MDKLQAMEVFMQVADTGSFTRAAQNLQLPKATVSTLVQRLEAHLAVKLLNRTTRLVSVTADGAAYYQHCQRILTDVRETEDSLSKNRSSPSGRLRVDVPSSLGLQVIIPALPQFFERYPGLALELGCSDRRVDLIEEGVDCVVRAGELPDSSMIARRVGTMHFATCAAPAYLDKAGRPEHPRELLGHQCVNYFSAKTGIIQDWDFARGDERIELSMPRHFSVNNSDAYLAACVAGLRVVQMPAFLLPPYLASGQLELILQDWTIDPLPLHAIYPRNRHLSVKVRVFVDWVIELFCATPALQFCPRSRPAPHLNEADAGLKESSPVNGHWPEPANADETTGATS